MLELKHLYQGFRDPQTIANLARDIQLTAKTIKQQINIMEVCGGHTHTIMKYGLLDLLPDNIEFIHGPGCPVCVMPKERIDQSRSACLPRKCDPCDAGRYDPRARFSRLFSQF